MTENPEWYENDGEIKLVDGQAIYFKGPKQRYSEGYRAGLRKAIEMMGTDKEPLKPWLTPADCAGIRNIYRAQLREALESELEKKK